MNSDNLWTAIKFVGGLACILLPSFVVLPPATGAQLTAVGFGLLGHAAATASK